MNHFFAVLIAHIHSLDLPVTPGSSFVIARMEATSGSVVLLLVVAAGGRRPVGWCRVVMVVIRAIRYFVNNSTLR